MSAHAPLVIDFSDFLSGEPARVKRCLALVREACETSGFFQIINHSIPSELQEEIFHQQRRLFNLPLEEKMKIDKSKNNYNRGYEKIGSQRFQAEDAKPDFKEGYYCSRDLPEDHHQVRAGKFAHGPNLWPESLGDSFKNTCNEYLRQITDLTKEVLRAVIMSLDNDTSRLDEFFTDPMCFFKMNYYPPPANPNDLTQKSHGAHRDFGVITLLLQGDVPGLEVWDEPTNQWVLVPPMKDAYVVNLGNLFSQWTNDRYISNLHRVINASGRERYSLAFLFHVSPDCSCCENSNLTNYNRETRIS
jgi:isopenicillin N synthase-like dioxygenase